MEYNKPQIEKTGNKKRGVVKRIEGYIFNYYSESVLGSNKDKSGIVTTFLIKESNGLEHKIEFNGFIDNGLVGREVQYEEETTTTTEFFSPRGRENDPAYRTGRRETKKICKLIPIDESVPSYTSVDYNQHSIF